MNEKRIIIVGGGIGGISTALSLAQKGHPCIVLERASEFTEVGAGIQLGPNAFNAFDRLGVGRVASQHSVFIDNLRFLDAVSGEDIATIPLGDEFRVRYGNPYAVIHRGQLHKVLVDACSGNPLVELRTNAPVRDVEQDESGVVAITEDGEQIKGAAMIGCDGINSRVRQYVVGDGAPRVSGHSTFRSVIPYDDIPEDLRINAATLWAGPKCHIVHYPLSDWKFFNLVVTFHGSASEPVAGRPVSPEEVRQGFEGVSPRIKRVIDSSNNWRHWVLCDREPVDQWTKGRVTLLGDAAHPTLQYFAQGACMALEDAVAIGDSTEAFQGDCEAAFQFYQSDRKLRTARIQAQSRAIGEYIYHPGGVAAELRNSMMGAKTPEDWYRSLDWLYGYNFPSLDEIRSGS